MWVKDYLMLSGSRPKWAYVADVLLAKAVTADSRSLDRAVRVNAFLQTWNISTASNVSLPPYLKSMIKMAVKYGVRFQAIDPSDALKDALPIWRHFALPDEYRLIQAKSVKCAMSVHRLADVGQATRMAARLNAVGVAAAHRPTANCCCNECLADKRNGCDNPHLCALAVRRILMLLAPRWGTGLPRPYDGLSLTVRRLQANVENGQCDGRVTFDPSIVAKLPLANHFRVFGKTHPADRTVVRRPPRGIALSGEETEVYTDGSCDKNGSVDAVAAGAVWFGVGDPRNCSSLVPGAVQSNQIAELFAISLAVAAVPPFAPLHIVTD
ncbi:hypothetical protein C8T65DRAFT_533772, partial [Cerioporus squamosus]